MGLARQHCIAVCEPSVLQSLLKHPNGFDSAVWFADREAALTELRRVYQALAAKQALEPVGVYLVTCDGSGAVMRAETIQRS